MNKVMIHNDTCIANTDTVTKEMLIGALPDKRFAKYVTPKVLDLVNSESDSELRRLFRDNVLSFASVMSKGKYSLTDYVLAVKFVSFKLMGDTSAVAYSKVFPDRYQRLINAGADKSKIASFADNFSKTKIVISIMEQTLVPVHIINAGIHQEAINAQALLMRTAKSEMVRMKAAECLINTLKAPDIAQVEIDIKHSNSIIDDLKAETRRLAEQQLRNILSGTANAQDVAHSQIVHKQTIDTDYTEIQE